MARPPSLESTRGAPSSGLLIILGGRSASGKTTLARALARELAAVHVRIDTIEAAIAASGAAVGELGYRVGYAMAADNLRLGRIVVADSVNPLEITREAWRRTAAEAGVPAFEVEIICSDAALHRRRFEAREADTPAQRLLTWDDVRKRDIEPWTGRHLVIDTAGRSVADCVAAIIDARRAL
jgi:predicted kinase